MTDVGLNDGPKLGRDAYVIGDLTGQRKVAAAALPYVKFAIIGSTGVVPRALGDDKGVWLMQLAVTTNVGDTLRQFRRRSLHALDVHFEAWTDAPRDVAQGLKARFDAELANAGRLLKEDASLFDVEPELALKGVLALCATLGVTLYDNRWYDAQVTKRTEANARLIGRAVGRR